MASRGRCPRCGYTLRHNMIHYVCDFCGLRQKRSISNILASLEKDLRRRVQNFLQNQKYAYLPQSSRSRSCIFCGFNFPSGNQRCPQCGRPLQNLTAFEERVFDYISSHGGTISLSQASRDLSVSPEVLSQAISRLKAIGILGET